MPKRHTKKNNKRSRRNVDGLSRPSPNRLLVLPSVTRIMPDRFYTKLCYEGVGPVAIPNTSTYTAFRFRPSAAYDVDPLLGSTATPGFAEMALLYAYYRVTCSRITIRVANPSTLYGIVVVITPTNEDPGAAPASNVVYSWSQNPYAKTKMAGMLGSSPLTLTNTMTSERIFGSTMALLDDTHAAGTATVPANNWFWCVGMMAGSVPAAAISCTVEYKIEMGVEFFERKQLLA